MKIKKGVPSVLDLQLRKSALMIEKAKRDGKTVIDFPLITIIGDEPITFEHFRGVPILK